LEGIKEVWKQLGSAGNNSHKTVYNSEGLAYISIGHGPVTVLAVIFQNKAELIVQ